MSRSMNSAARQTRLLLCAGLTLCIGLLPGAPLHAQDFDVDRDGMGDNWEAAHGGDLDPAAHDDSDGVSNLDEWIADTDPQNPTSFFRASAIAVAGPNPTVVSWHSSADRSYGVMWSSNILDQFSILATGLVATPPFNTYTDTSHTGVQRGFYSLNARWTGYVDAAQNCIVCHTFSMNGRRAVVGDFSKSSHHVQGAVAPRDCIACHRESWHQGGSVVLLNADNPQTTYTLTGDPLTNSVEAAKLNDFCLACHDADGAGGKAPFADGQMPPERDSAAWAASAHNQNSISCFGDGQVFGCHSTTHGSDKQNMLAPFDSGVPTAPDYAGQEEGFCFGCHDGTTSKDLTADFAKAVHHPVVNSEQASGRSVECLDCHSTHIAQSGGHVYTNLATSTRNLIGNPGKGVSGWAIDYAGLANFEAPTNDDYSTVTSTYQYEMCFKCHAAKSWGFGTPPDGLSPNGTDTNAVQTDLAQAFSPNNRSGHPIVTGLDNYTNSIVVNGKRGLPASNMKEPWTNVGQQTMKCIDCHMTDASSPAAQGPHGSDNQFMLRGPNAANWPDHRVSNFDTSWCANCHNKGTGEGHQSQHSSRRCYECHITVPHGGKLSRLMADNDTMPARLAYNSTLSSGDLRAFTKRAENSYDMPDCLTSCHGETVTPDENW